MAPRKTSKPLDDAGARGKALRALARREHSAAELRHKLEHRGLDEDAAQAVVENLTRAGWQSDARYAEAMVRSRIAQGCGPQRIEADLEQAGVSAAEIAAALGAAEADWYALAADLRRRRFGAAAPRAASDWQKQYRYLAGRGFTSEQVHRALKKLPPEME